MFLSQIETLSDTGNDYAVLIDYGSEGMRILSTHNTVVEAIVARDKCNYGSPMAVIKVCRIAETVEL